MSLVDQCVASHGARFGLRPSTPRTTAGRTAWERVLEGVGDDGTVSEETALAAFSLAVAELLGVDGVFGEDGGEEAVDHGVGPDHRRARRGTTGTLVRATDDLE